MKTSVSQFKIHDKPEPFQAVLKYTTQLEAAFQAMNDGVLIFDMSGDFVFANEAEARILGFDSVSEMRRNLDFFTKAFELIDAGGKRIPIENWPVSRVLRGESLPLIEIDARRKDTGQQWCFGFSGEPVFDDEGRQILAVVITRDLTEMKKAEEQLKSREWQMRQFVENSPFAVAMLDREMRYVFASQKWLSDYHMEVKDIRGKSHYELFPEIPERWKEIHRRCLQGTIEKNDAEAFHRADGRIDWIRWEVRPWYDHDRVGGLLIFSEDISDRKNSEEALRASERSLSFAMSSAAMGAWTIDLKNQTTTLSAEAQKLFESPGVFTDPVKAIEEIVYPEDRQRVKEVLQKSIDQNTVYSDEFRIRRPDSEVRWLGARGQAVLDSSKKPVAFAGIVMDIHERKSNEIALQEREATLKTVLERLPVGVVIANAEGKLMANNPALDQIWGKTLIGAGVDRYGEYEGYWFDTGQRLKSSDWGLTRALTKHETSLSEVIRIRNFNGESKIVSNSALPIYTKSGELVGALAVVQDITAQKENELELHRARIAAESANQMKSAFLANMSHEIRTPLSAILGFSDLMVGEGVSEEDRRNFHEIIQRNGRQLTSLIDDILDLSKIEAGELKIEKIKCPVRNVVDEVLSLLKVRANEKGLELNCRVEPDVPDLVETDPIRLRQILTNVIGNAVKFTQKGSVDVEMDFGRDQMVRFKVIDTGIGLKTEQVQKLFRPFSQADESITRKYGGTGLGLVLSRRLAQALDGDLSLKSTVPGKGSVFELVIPVTSESVREKPAK